MVRHDSLCGADRAPVDLIALTIQWLRAHPAQMSRGDELLAISRQRGQQRIAAVRIKLAKNVVQQQDGRLLADLVQQRGLSQFQRQSDGALLPFRGESAGRQPVQRGRKIVAVRPADSDPAAGFLRPAIVELAGERYGIAAGLPR